MEFGASGIEGHEGHGASVSDGPAGVRVRKNSRQRVLSFVFAKKIFSKDKVLSRCRVYINL